MESRKSILRLGTDQVAESAGSRDLQVFPLNVNKQLQAKHHVGSANKRGPKVRGININVGHNQVFEHNLDRSVEDAIKQDNSPQQQYEPMDENNPKHMVWSSLDKQQFVINRTIPITFCCLMLVAVIILVLASIFFQNSKRKLTLAFHEESELAANYSNITHISVRPRSAPKNEYPGDNIAPFDVTETNDSIQI